MDTNTAWETLQDFAEGRIEHINAGSCPDCIEGFGQRDIQCPVCRALDAIAGPAPAAVAGPAEPLAWTPGPNEFKDWCAQWFGPDSDDNYLAEAVHALPPMAQRFARIAAPALEAPAAPMSPAEACAALAINSALHRIRAGNAAGAIEPLEQAHAALAAAPQAQTGAPDWWRKRADEIEAQVAATGSSEAMRCYTDMRTLLQSAAAPQAPAAPSAVATQVIENLLQLARIVNTAVEDWGESFEDGSMEVTFHKEEADAMEAILEFFDSLPDAPPEESVIESGPLRAARVLRALAAPAAPAVDASDTALLDAMERERIAVIPEFEGPWDAQIFGEDEAALACGSGVTPRKAIAEALASLEDRKAHDAAQAKEGGA